MAVGIPREIRYALSRPFDSRKGRIPVAEREDRVKSTNETRGLRG